MKTRVTILCENTVGKPMNVIAEHGFACYIETDGSRWLFDTGQGLGIIPNARLLRKDLAAIQAIMISHGHYDHAGGLPAVLEVRGTVDVYGHPGMFRERYGSKDGQKRFVGIPHRRAYLEALGARFHLSREMVSLGSGVHLTGEIPRENPFEKGDPSLFQISDDGNLLPDPIEDDLSCVIDTREGLIIILGCAHAGMINIMAYVARETGRKRIFAVLGGTHLGFAGDEQFEATLDFLDQHQVRWVGVSHCTGPNRAAALHAKLGPRFFFGNVGATLEV